VPAECERLLVSVLGEQTLEALTQAMLDVALPPIDLKEYVLRVGGGELAVDTSGHRPNT
jgi:hypothetical protein